MAGLDNRACATEEELKLRVAQLCLVPGNIETAANEIFENLVEDVLLGIVFEEHQLNRVGHAPSMKDEELKPFGIVDNVEMDIFGQQLKKTPSCISICPSCNRQLSASRFAPHLAGCLGMGRNSSRIASRRIANNCKENTYGGISDDDFDEWVTDKEKSKLNKKIEGKKKRDKNGIRKNKPQKTMTEKNNNGGKVPEDFSQSTKYDNPEIKKLE